jgi:hypothetical protein
VYSGVSDSEVYVDDGDIVASFTPHQVQNQPYSASDGMDVEGELIPARYEERHPSAGRVVRKDDQNPLGGGTGGASVANNDFFPFDSLTEAMISIHLAKSMTQGNLTKLCKISNVSYLKPSKPIWLVQVG